MICRHISPPLPFVVKATAARNRPPAQISTSVSHLSSACAPFKLRDKSVDLWFCRSRGNIYAYVFRLPWRTCRHKTCSRKKKWRNEEKLRLHCSCCLKEDLGVEPGKIERKQHFPSCITHERGAGSTLSISCVFRRPGCSAVCRNARYTGAIGDARPYEHDYSRLFQRNEGKWERIVGVNCLRWMSTCI